MERHSFGQTVLAIFLAPTQAFNNLVDGATWKDWVYPLIVVSVILSLVPLSYRAITLDEAEYRLKRAEKQIMSNPDISEAQKENIVKRFDKGRDQLEAARENPWAPKQLLGYLLIPVTILVLSSLFALILLAIGNFGMGGKVTFFQMLSAVLLSYLIGGSGIMFNMTQGIGSLETVIKAPFIIMKEGTDVVFSLGLLFESLDSFVKVFLNELDVFRIWSTVVLGIGFARLYNKSTGTGIVTVMIPWLIFIALGAAMMRLNGMAMG